MDPATLSAHLAYWRTRLGDAPPALELPTDRPRRPGTAEPVRAHAFAVPATLTSSLGSGAPASTVVLAAFAAVVHRYTGQDDFVLGARLPGLDGRTHTLPLRLDASGDPGFRAWLGRVQAAVEDAARHPVEPVDRLVEALAGRAVAPGALFRVMVALAATAGAPAALEGAELALVAEAAGADATAAVLRYEAGLFDDATAARMAGHLLTLLAGAVADPDAPLSALPLLTPAERHQLVVAWNATDADYPREACLHELFEAQVRRRPDAVAVLAGDATLTYAELDRRANRLAHALRRLGVAPEARVGICLERAVELVVAILGVLKAGGAYVPLDPGYPRERLAFMLEDAKVAVLLTQARLRAAVPAGTTPCVCLDADAGALAREPDHAPASDVTAEHLAYVIYTSGSTGRPKGIALRHTGVVNNLVDLNRSFAIGPADRVLAISSPSFDMCVYEVLGTLEAGGAIVLPEAARERDPAHWAALMHRHGVTVWNSAPPLLGMLVEHAEAHGLRFDALRVAILGGDWVPVTMPDRLRARAPGVRVVVLGGATEASIHSIVYPVDRTDPTWRSIPYGRPMRNQRAYILDRHVELVPVGVPGELYLGGVGLARGYVDRPDLTAEKFLPNPFGGPGERIYRTGDLARWRPDGTIELLGRIDFQVKIHGHRIELGEIVAALKTHPAVQHAVVVAREDRPGVKRLVAYVVADPAARPSPGELRALLRDRLPGYMVPSAVVLLDRLPLSPNGKVDRRALPPPDPGRPDLGTPLVAPRTPLEAALAALWAELLGLDRVGVEDDFFELGGSSIQAAQLVNRLQERLGEIVHVVAVFDAPTVAALAAYLTTHYPAAIARLVGAEAPAEPAEVGADAGRRLDTAAVARARQLLRRRQP